MLLLQRAKQQRGALAAQTRRDDAAEQAGLSLMQPQPQHVVRLARRLEKLRRRLGLGFGFGFGFGLWFGFGFGFGLGLG